jgi:DNA-binding IclR family transcriptional regulator
MNSSEKEAMRKLREARKDSIKTATRRVKAQKKIIEAIKRNLNEGAKTVPELAEGAGISTADAMWYVATLKKYGVVAEGEKDGSYFRYELAGDAAETAADAREEG